MISPHQPQMVIGAIFEVIFSALAELFVALVPRRVKDHPMVAGVTLTVLLVVVVGAVWLAVANNSG